MVGLYFSGTGNTKYCVETFVKAYDKTSQAFSIEDDEAITQLQKHNKIVIGYPVQYSNIPKILKEFLSNHKMIWKDKEVFIIATMGLFSGDGAGILARYIKPYGATIVGGLHLKMPDSICDEKALKRTLEHNKKLVTEAEVKIQRTVDQYKKGVFSKDGLGFFCQMIGLFGQRLYFYHKTKSYSDKLNIHSDQCVGCGTCVSLCPMKNIQLVAGLAVASNQCTLCYRCLNHCPTQAITLLGKKVVEQGNIDRYIK